MTSLGIKAARPQGRPIYYRVKESPKNTSATNACTIMPDLNVNWIIQYDHILLNPKLSDRHSPLPSRKTAVPLPRAPNKLKAQLHATYVQLKLYTTPTSIIDLSKPIHEGNQIAV